MKTIKDKILTLEDVAQRKGASTESIIKDIEKGKLKATYFHGAWHIRESNYLEYEKSYPKHTSPSKLVTIHQAAEVLNISQAIILRAIRKGHIKTYECANGIRILLDSLLEWDKTHFTGKR